MIHLWRTGDMDETINALLRSRTLLARRLLEQLRLFTQRAYTDTVEMAVSSNTVVEI